MVHDLLVRVLATAFLKRKGKSGTSAAHLSDMSAGFGAELISGVEDLDNGIRGLRTYERGRGDRAWFPWMRFWRD